MKKLTARSVLVPSAGGNDVRQCSDLKAFQIFFLVCTSYW